MKRIAVLFLGLGVLLLAPKVALADLASDYQNYLTSVGTYNSLFGDYVTARANYLASGSIDSQDKAREATLKMLQARDVLLVSYLTALNSRIDSQRGISDGDKNSLKGQISNEINWYSLHNNKLPSAGNLDDLVSDSDEAKVRFNDFTTLLVYRSLVNLGVAQNSSIRGDINSQIDNVKSKISEIKSNGDKDTSTIERSLVDVENKIARSQDKDNASLNIVNSIRPNSFNTLSDFQESQQDLTDSQAYLREATRGLLQIITQIKTN